MSNRFATTVVSVLFLIALSNLAKGAWEPEENSYGSSGANGTDHHVFTSSDGSVIEIGFGYGKSAFVRASGAPAPAGIPPYRTTRDVIAWGVYTITYRWVGPPDAPPPYESRATAGGGVSSQASCSPAVVGNGAFARALAYFGGTGAGAGVNSEVPTVLPPVHLNHLSDQDQAGHVGTEEPADGGVPFAGVSVYAEGIAGGGIASGTAAASADVVIKPTGAGGN